MYTSLTIVEFKKTCVNVFRNKKIKVILSLNIYITFLVRLLL